MKFTNNIMYITLTWILFIIMLFTWNYINIKKNRENAAFQVARSFFTLIVITREWDSRHGGIYAPVTEKTLPNPYLKVENRDIVVNDTMTLTKINPAYMTRQLSEIAEETKGLRLKITSLNPIRPQNKATSRETKILQEFEKGRKEKGMFIHEDSQSSFFYMAPLITQKSCLQCHSDQGYKEGDIRGGISITLPFEPEIPWATLSIAHILIALAGIFGIVFSGRSLRKAYDIIERQALFDALTQIPNRQNFLETILKEFKISRRDKKPLSAIMCDIDHFKMFNDTYGHSSGDKCLKKVAQGIKSSLKRPSDFCARYGGEEFIIILPDTDLNGAKIIAERIRSNIEKMRILNEKSLPDKVITLSLGIAIADDTTTLTSYEDLIKQADLALYKAKEKGRNQVQIFDNIV